MKTQKPKTILLAILDGWGVTKPGPGNAVTLADMSFVKKLEQKYPHVLAEASGRAVGLPSGQIGNSEVGHLHIGAGRINKESLSLINDAIATKQFINNAALLKAISYAKQHNSNFHLMGLFSDGGVHSHMNHMIAAFKIIKSHGLKKVFFHLIGDGRDTKPAVMMMAVKQLQDLIHQYQVGTIATIAGRYYTMDRDKRFDRTERAFNNMVFHKGNTFTDPVKYIEAQYDADISDEFLEPGYNTDAANSQIKDGDVVFFTNFRPDRAIQIASAFTNPAYLWKPPVFFKNLFFLTMRKYSDSVLASAICFPPQPLMNTLGTWISKQGLKQLRIAETEKIAHVTFFFDGQKDFFKNGLATPAEISLPGASKILIPSPKVATYDLAPQMSAIPITEALITALRKDHYDLVVLNFANCDMVGHTGFLAPTIKAVQTIDKCLAEIYAVMPEINGTMIITGDHGNAEVMIDPDNGGPSKKHTTNKVPIIITDDTMHIKSNARICDLAPTILTLLNLPIPAEMTCPSLIK